ncbi:cell division protein ZipA [Luminiphilus sp. nBUS_16]|uniref:cell division protein ZipA n=1 Tax=Luminiphilus sp. nBUS_16 TaxID=3395315 RepID=UPI003EBD0CA6
MDHMIRDWMIIIGVCLIMVVLIDALRRVFKDRRDEVRLNAKISRRDLEEVDDDSFDLLTELPNGGARIVSRSDLQPSSVTEGAAAESVVTNPMPSSDASTSAVSAQAATESSEVLSTHQEPAIESDPEPKPKLESEPELPSFSATDDDHEPVSFAPAQQAELAQDPVPEASPENTVAQAAKSGPQDEDSAVETMDWLEGLDVPEAEPEPEARLPRDLDPHVFVLNVMSRSESGFAGSDILGVLLACDLRFGDMDFFHRHEHRAGRGPIQFSVCNMLKPGVFNIDEMGSLYTRGLMFFITLPGPEDMLKAFDYMHETAKAVAKNLDGYLLDETRSGVTRQSIEHMRQQIRELERRVALQNRR